MLPRQADNEQLMLTETTIDKRIKTGAPLFPEEDLMEFDNGLIAGLDYAAAKESSCPRSRV